MSTNQNPSPNQLHANSQPSPDADLSLPPFVRMAMVIRMTGLGRTTIYRMMAADKFPCPVRLAKRAVGWRRSDLEQWSQARPTVAH
ncbi:MAG: AlpA family phage regulatory protein [Rhodoferax sp.]|nr:AlpA family phage regulatory protein [Rhodoferax sp.]